MLAKLSTQLTMHTHPSAGVFNLLKFAASHEEEEEEDDENVQKSLDIGWTLVFTKFHNDVEKMWDYLKNYL